MGRPSCAQPRRTTPASASSATRTTIAAVLAELDERGSLSDETRRALALKAFRLTAAYDAAIAAVLGRALDPRGSIPERPTLALRRAAAPPLRREPAPGRRALPPRRCGSGGPVRSAPERGSWPASRSPTTTCSMAPPRLALARDLQGPAVAIVKHGNPCGAAEADDLVTAWQRALEADPVSAFGGVVAVRGSVDVSLAEALAASSSRWSSRRRSTSRPSPPLRGAGRTCGWWRTRRSCRPAVRRPMELRSAGGALLVSRVGQPGRRSGRLVGRQRPSARRPGDRPTWPSPGGSCDTSSRTPSFWRGRRPSSAWVPGRRAVSESRATGRGSRRRARRRRRGGLGRVLPVRGRCEACLAAGVTAIIQPGGSKRDGEVIAAVDAAGAAMVFTGRRHFRH